MNTAGAGLGKRVVLKDPSHVVEQSGDAQKHIGRQIAVLPVQQCIGVGVTLVRSFCQPVDTPVSIVLHTLSHKIHFTEHVLGVLASVLCGSFKPLRRRSVASRYVVAFVILLAQTVGGVVIAVLRGDLQPAHSRLRITHFNIIGELELAERVLRIHMSLLRSLPKPVSCLRIVRCQQRPVAVQLAHEILGIHVTLSRQLFHVVDRIQPVFQRVVRVIDVVSVIPIVTGAVF